MYIDTHAHLESKDFDSDRSEVIERAREAGIDLVVDPATSLEDSRRVLDLARKHREILPAIGVHPHYTSDWNNDELSRLRHLCEQSPVAIGEIGLDFCRDLSPRNQQMRAFEDQLMLAGTLDLPVIIHCRDAHDQCFELLERHNGLRGVMHCFGGTSEDALRAVSLGFFVSFTGRITHPRADRIREVAAVVNPEDLLLETDCPIASMTPRPHKGRNEPAFIPLVAEALAQIHKLSPTDIARITTFNARRLFDIEGDEHRDVIVYPIRDSLYVNLTNQCTNECAFCPRSKEMLVKGHQLYLQKEPTVEQVTAAIGDPADYHQIVFCGFGEPTIRLDELKTIAVYVKERGGNVRINTNGQGSLIHNRSIVPELEGLVDAVSVSLNTSDRNQYDKLCRSTFGLAAFDGVVQFVRDAAGVIPDVTVTAIDQPGVNIEACKRLANSLGAKFRLRRYNVVG